MKTKSITSIAALLSAAVILNVSALAGPDPQLVPSLLRAANERRNDSQEKKVTIALYGHHKAPTTTSAKPASNSDSTVLIVPGPHGDNKLIYRR